MEKRKYIWLTAPGFKRSHLVDSELETESLCSIVPFQFEWNNSDGGKPHCKNCQRMIDAGIKKIGNEIAIQLANRAFLDYVIQSLGIPSEYLK